ncbi:MULTISPECIES: FidL-like protein [Photorhabdus]|uniref:Uncharacterized protein n=2 Tax=Photorhabdus asymbiotica TaxID=291112 RepID=C7BJK3_PHOAA|nr:FidL-like putative membrane protein [Photorhabdus asymbiotica]CAQ85528.1 Hypothetical protein PAU_03440 [Photorhabdus asymbiotica]
MTYRSFFLFILAVVLFIISFIYKSSYVKTRPLNCEAEVIIRKKIKDEIITLHVNTIHLFHGNGKGTISIYGTLQDGTKHYILDRIISFTYSDDDNNGIYVVKYTNSQPKTIDNTPTNLMSFFYEIGNNDYYIELSRLRKNTLLFSQLSKSPIICLMN